MIIFWSNADLKIRQIRNVFENNDDDMSDIIARPSNHAWNMHATVTGWFIWFEISFLNLEPFLHPMLLHQQCFDFDFMYWIHSSSSKKKPKKRNYDDDNDDGDDCDDGYDDDGHLLIIRSKSLKYRNSILFHKEM